MKKTWAILPVKTFDRAKSRLGMVLTGDQCEAVARLMATDVLIALTGVPGIADILVVGQGSAAASLAAEFGCQFTADDPELDLCGNLTRATATPGQIDIGTLLVIPADLPTLCSDDLARIIEPEFDGITICRASRDGGTNALVATPPDSVKFCFGHDSARRHAEAAQAMGRPVRILDELAFQRDIDTPDDLRWLCKQETNCRTAAYLHRSGLADSLDEPPSKAIAS